MAKQARPLSRSAPALCECGGNVETIHSWRTDPGPRGNHEHLRNADGLRAEGPEPISAARVASTRSGTKTGRKRNENFDARDGGRVCVGIAGGVGQRSAGSGAAKR